MKKDGGGAFPALEQVQEYREDRYVDVYQPMGGMSLRDYFAGQALTAMVMRFQEGSRTFSQIVAEQAYEYADAMLKERSK